MMEIQMFFWYFALCFFTNFDDDLYSERIYMYSDKPMAVAVEHHKHSREVEYGSAVAWWVRRTDNANADIKWKIEKGIKYTY